MSEIKIAKTTYPVLDVIKNRWSARSFSDKPISEDELKTLIEAASWAFSAMNEQPWRFSAAHKGTALWQRMFDALGGGNQPWCKDAAVLMVVWGKKNYTSNDQENHSMQHDVGAANMLLALQASSMGIYSHVMGGYDKAKAAELLTAESDLVPVVMFALGYLDAPEKLNEPYKTRELTPRVRKPLSELLIQHER